MWHGSRHGHTEGEGTGAQGERDAARRRGVKLKPTELGATDLRSSTPPPELAALARGHRGDGGAVLAAYREPLGGHALLFAALPVDKVEPTPFQRDVSDAHVRKLTAAMDKTRALPRPDHRGARGRRAAT